MNRRAGSFRNARGMTLHTVSWRPDGEAAGTVVLAHGYGEHAGRYTSLAHALVERRFSVHALDFSGHGRSTGRRGEVSSFRDFMADLGSYLDSVRDEEPGLPCGLFGHSLGGAVSAALLSERPRLVDALVLSSPYLRHGQPVSNMQMRAVQALARLFPHLGVEKVESDALSRIPAEVDAYRHDPLVYSGRVPARTVLQLFSGAEVLEHADHITVPLLIVHGSDDRIAHPDGSRELAGRVGSSDVTLEIVEGGYHELLNDVGREAVERQIVDWFADRLSG